MSSVLDVAANQDRLAAGFDDQPLGLFGILFFVQVGNEYIRTLPRVGQRHRPPDAAIATRDDGFSTLQPAGTLVGFFAVVRDRAHLRG
jgi:hypothetical protein